MTIQQILAAAAALTPQQRGALIINLRQLDIQQAQAAIFIGMPVEFSGKGQRLTGVVESIGPKNCKVRADNGQRWTVYVGFIKPLQGKVVTEKPVSSFFMSPGQKAAATRRARKMALSGFDPD